MANQTLLFIEDEEVQREALKAHLEEAGYQVLTAETAETGLSVFKKQVVHCVLSDFQLPGMNGQEFLKALQSLNPAVPVILVTAFASINGAVEAMQAGAFHYLTKPVNVDELLLIIKRALHHQTLLTENRRLKQLLEEQHQFDDVIASSSKMQGVLNLAGRVAVSKASVLLRGESGTGKEVIARTIHHASPRKDKPFVAFNVAALSPSLIESELFGHEKGAFTGADKQRIGRFEQAHGGTLFIDEIGDIPAEVQVKFLRVLQENRLERLGGNAAIDVDIRIIAATHKNLEEMMKTGTFREDLFYRLNVVTIQIPPLRERKEDIPSLSQFFIRRAAGKNELATPGITREAFDALMKYHFPGNVRELENMMERAVILCREAQIDSEDLPDSVRWPVSVSSSAALEDGLDARVEALEKSTIDQALRNSGGNQSKAARALKITERKLRYKMAKYGLERI